MADSLSPPPGAAADSRRGLARGLGIASAGLLFLAWAVAFIWRSSFVAIDGRRYFCLFDDAMISMRYAWNLAHGDGLAWNAGERVEGITNFLWTLCMSVPAALLEKSSAVLAVQILGLLLLLVAAFLALRIGERLLAGTELAGRPLPSILFFAAPLAYYPLAFWALMGMETALLAVLQLAAVLIALRDGDRARPLPKLAILLGLAFLTRPDAAVPIALIMLYRLLRVARQWLGWRAVVIESAVIAAFVAGISIFRKLYYGEFLPNTFTLKVSGFSAAERVSSGIDFLTPYWESIWIAVAFAGLAIAINRSRHSVFVLALPLAALAYQIWVGGEPWPYWRILAPTVPLIFVLCVAEGAKLLRLSSGRAARRAGPALRTGLRALEGALVLGGLLLIVMSANRAFAPELLFREPAYFVPFNARNVNVALALGEVVKPDATVGVTWGGTIPYYTGLKAIDFLGKSDRRIAALPPVLGDPPGPFDHMPGHNKYDLAYSIGELQPTYIQTGKWGHQDVTPFVRSAYSQVRYKSTRLLLRKKSPQVRWKVLRAAQRRQK